MLSLDETDKKIISLLAENPESTQSEIAQILKISQPAIGSRIHKLKKQGVIAHQVGLNLARTKLGIAKIDISTHDSAKILETLEEKCPLFMNGFVTSGKHNLCLFLVYEDLSSVNACMDRHLRENPLVSDVELTVVVSSAKDVIFPLKLRRMNEKITPCGKQCDKCHHYEVERCFGCPNTIYYKGVLLGVSAHSYLNQRK